MPVWRDLLKLVKKNRESKISSEVLCCTHWILWLKALLSITNTLENKVDTEHDQCKERCPKEKKTPVIWLSCFNSRVTVTQLLDSTDQAPFSVALLGSLAAAEPCQPQEIVVLTGNSSLCSPSSAGTIQMGISRTQRVIKVGKDLWDHQVQPSTTTMFINK